MRVGMAINEPKTEEDRNHIRKIILALDEAAFHSTFVELWIEGKPAHELLGAISEQLMQLYRRQS